MKVRCIQKQDIAWLSVGDVYEAERPGNHGWLKLTVGDCWFPRTWFEPIPDEPEANHDACPKCGDDDGYSGEYGHCIGCGWSSRLMVDMAHPGDEPEAPAKQPKVDQYEAHRLEQPSESILSERMAARGRTSGATARLLRGLEGEKVRERVRAFPHPARNPR